MPVCIKCALDKDEESFPFRSKAQNVRRNVCRSCIAVINNNYRLNHLEERKLYLKEYRQRMPEKVKENNKKHHNYYLEGNRNKMLDYLKDKVCVRCGYSDYRALQFHHINPITKKENVSKMLNHSWKQIEQEIEKCEILCANCHQIETIETNSSYRAKSKNELTRSTTDE